MPTTFRFAPPWRGPLSEPSDAAIAEYVSVPVDDTTCVVNDELLPPPCSACSTSVMSRISASSSVNLLSGRSMCRKFSAVEYSGSGRWMTRLLPWNSSR